ncbi:MAG TPA: serine/threonine-protein kinase [Gemmatimonadales bacterium]|nr:serine/threonine-protein kinase [Gemmatimonadales bacterium]
MADTLERLKPLLADRYLIERELGKGGMATVFLATDVRHDREVAIKVLHPELSVSIGAERFEREIKLAAKLQHPNILGLYDSGTVDGLLYYVMPFIKGESLRDRLDREGQLPIDDAVQIALEVAEALGAAHAAGIVHRDIKPENVLLSGGHALVADFGIARAASEGGAQKLTQTGMAVGTPVYMSPEQSVGDPVGPTADLYSLGCMLYEMLAGEPPFTAKNAMALMARHSMEAVPSVRIVRSTVPEEVEDAIFASMAKVPADRPQTAAQFMEMLGLPMGATASRRTAIRHTASRRIPTGASRVYEPEPVPWWRRRLVLGLGAVGVVATAATAFLLIRKPAVVSSGASNVRKIAVLTFEDQSKDKSLGYLAEGLTTGLISTLTSVPELDVRSRDAVAPYRATTLPLDSLGKRLDVGTIVRGTLETEGDKIRVSFQVMDASSNSSMSNGNLSLSSANQLAIRDSVSRLVGVQISDRVRRILNQEITVREQKAGTANALAWTLVQRAEREREGAEAARGDSAALRAGFQTVDSLLAQAEQQDGRWIEPVVLRAVSAYRHAYLSPRDALLARPWLDAGLGHADRALAMDSTNADALEVRGNLKYLGYLDNVETDADRKQALLLSAQHDLEKATDRNPRQAGAWATLSHLYNQIPEKSGTDVELAASKALDADAYLANADVIMWRLFTADYDLGQSEKAKQTCDRIQQRFSANANAMRCQLLVLTTRAGQPDIARAWKLADSVVALTPERRRAYQRLDSDIFAAWVIARAAKARPELADSARRVARRAEGDAELDPTRDLALRGAFVYVELHDNKEALRLLKLYFAVNPQRIAAYAIDPGWQISPIKDDPEFKRLIGRAGQ